MNGKPILGRFGAVVVSCGWSDLQFELHWFRFAIVTEHACETRDSDGPPPILKHFHYLHIARQNEGQVRMHSPNFGVVPDDERFDPFNRSVAAPALRFTSSSPYCERHLHSLDVDHIPPPSPMPTTVSISRKGKFYAIQVDLTNTVTSS